MAKGRKRAGKPGGASGRTPSIQDSALLKALAHPVRARALTVLNQRVASPSELAAEQGYVVGYVAYHVRVLHELGVIELVSTRQVRGATEHFYRGSSRPLLSDEFWAKLPEDARTSISVANLGVLNDAIKESLAANVFDSRADRHLSNVSLDLDEAGWHQATELLSTTLKRLMEIGNESAARKPAETIRATFAMMGFESPGR